MTSQDMESSADRNVEMWKIKKLIKSLEAARGFVAKFTCLLKAKMANSFTNSSRLNVWSETKSFHGLHSTDIFLVLTESNLFRILL